MKHRTVLAAAASLMMLLPSVSKAQSPTTTYPYLYPTFVEGKVILSGGKEEQKKMNVHLRHDNLHYIDDGIVKSAFLTDVLAVEIGGDVFLPVEGQMLRVAAKDEKGFVVEEIKGDFEGSVESGGAYGTSSTTSATMKLTSIQSDSQLGQTYMNILNEKSQGVELRVESKLYLYVSGTKIRATKKDVGDFLGEGKAGEWKTFLKTHKIKWKEPQSLLLVVDYLSEIQ